ncbi:flagellar basal body rod protein FlgB [Clostridium akagii]|uniref:flagellar basal body rod protein FlgB n=1 Tax=Clostridium akagii TaxID=91623 RepID=UPI00047D6BF8|nr:flagellar basal body rod protein FlgB [Clostridium akagii]
MSTSGISQSGSTYDLIKQALNASSTRGNVIADNIANVNTDNYKEHYVTFEDTLNNTMDNITMKKNNSKHLDDGNTYGSISVKQDNTTSMKNDGNNVDIDSEMSNQAKNTLMYQALANQASTRISMEKYAITGGGN